MGAHVFLVGEANFEICTRRGVYGCVMPTTEWNKAEVIAGILSVQPNDLVFFYVKNRGIYGLWKVIGETFFDETKVWDNADQLFPYRFTFEPVVGQFSVPVSLSDVLDLRDKGRVWTFDLNPVQQKNQYKITMDEARELLRLLLRNNPIRQSAPSVMNPFKPAVRRAIEIDLTPAQGGRVRYEAWLNAWFMRTLAGGGLKETLGDYREFLNLVPTTFNKVMDIFLTHVTSVDGIDILHKFTCLELKADRATADDLAQVLRYQDWLARRLAAGDDEMIQAVLVARRFTEDVVNYVRSHRRIEEKTVRLLSYSVCDRETKIELQEEPST
jgi:hypothetical protein